MKQNFLTCGIKLPLQYFAEPDPANNENNNTGGNAGNTSGNTGKTFTQEEVNALMMKEKNSGRMSILKELGVEDAKTVKEALEKYNQYLDSQKTDLEKAQSDYNAEKLAKEQALSQVTSLSNKFEAISFGVKVECAEDVLALATPKISAEKTLKTVLEELKTKYPDFFTSTENNEGKNKGTGNSVGGKKLTAGEETLGERLAKSRLSSIENKSTYFK